MLLIYDLIQINKMDYRQYSRSLEAVKYGFVVN